MTRQEHLDLLKKKMDANLDTATRKNQDYCGKNEENDPFSNFKLASILSNGRLSVEDSIFTRLADKIARVGTLLSQDAQVNDESIQDTLGDLSNYALILSNYLDSKKFKIGKPLPIHPDDVDSTDDDLFYKVGDKVKIIKANGAPADLLGKIGTVVEVHSNYFNVSIGDGYLWAFKSEHVEAV
jgi:hypothetical protein